MFYNRRSVIMKEHFNVMNPFEPLFKPIIGIANAFLKIGELIMLFVKLFIKVITTANVLFDPPRFINDIIIGSVIGISQFINSLLERFSLSNYFRSAVSNNENCNNNSNNNNSNNNNSNNNNILFNPINLSTIGCFYRSRNIWNRSSCYMCFINYLCLLFSGIIIRYINYK